MVHFQPAGVFLTETLSRAPSPLVLSREQVLFVDLFGAKSTTARATSKLFRRSDDNQTVVHICCMNLLQRSAFLLWSRRKKCKNYHQVDRCEPLWTTAVDQKIDLRVMKFDSNCTICRQKVIKFCQPKQIQVVEKLHFFQPSKLNNHIIYKDPFRNL